MLQSPQVTNKVIDLIAWMRTHDPAERYDWGSGGNCLIAQYSKHLGMTMPVHRFSKLCGGVANYYHIARGTGDVTASVIYHKDWTFGGAVKRAEELLA